ncbi:hypothetical protein ACI3PL_28685, partial [Lacticaseibacillus paracasei]
QLLAQVAKFHSYTAGQVSENLEQIYEHIKAMFELYKPSLDAATSQNRQLVISKIGKRDTAQRIPPNDAYDNEGNQIR